MTHYQQNLKRHYTSLRGDSVEVISSIYNSGYNIKKFYLGSQELNLAYLGNQVIYDEVIGDSGLNYILYEFYGSDTLPNTVEVPVKRAILKGSTKYRDIDTGEFLETFEEGRNLELVSVKMPVLKATGKNLFDGELEKGLIDGNTGKPSNNEAFVRSVNFIKVQPNKTYVISEKDDSTNFRVYEYDENFNYIDSHSKKTFTTYSNTYYIKFRTFPKNSGDDVSRLDFKVMLETGDTATPYEAHKSNILTTSEEVTLRGIGNVKDELDLLTSEVTERIGEYQITGEENWVFLPSFRRLQMQKSTFIPNIKCGVFACDILQAKQGNDASLHGTVGTYYIGYTKDNWLRIILGEDLTSLEQGKEWLKANKPTIQYQLMTESVKTVDLTIVDQDEKTINKLNSFNGTTHVSTEVAENSIYPTIAIEVATE